jgi:hypothetical protein
MEVTDPAETDSDDAPTEITGKDLAMVPVDTNTPRAMDLEQASQASRNTYKPEEKQVDIKTHHVCPFVYAGQAPSIKHPVKQHLPDGDHDPWGDFPTVEDEESDDTNPYPKATVPVNLAGLKTAEPCLSTSYDPVVSWFLP